MLRFHSLLRAAFAQGVRWGLIDRNPTDRATPPRVNRPEIKPPPIEDVLRVIDRAAASRKPENALVFRLLAATGCRPGEICGLKWQDIDFDEEMLRQPPTLKVYSHLMPGAYGGAASVIGSAFSRSKQAHS